MKYNIPDRVMHDIIKFAKKDGITKIILFGSRAKGTHTERSDIDLAVSGGNYLDFHEDLNENAYTQLMFDVVNLDGTLSDKLRQNIAKDRVVIYG